MVFTSQVLRGSKRDTKLRTKIPQLYTLWWLYETSVITFCLFYSARFRFTAHTHRGLGRKSFTEQYVSIIHTTIAVQNVQISSGRKRDPGRDEEHRAESKRLHFYLCWSLLLPKCWCHPTTSSVGLPEAAVLVALVSSRISTLIVHLLSLHAWLLWSRLHEVPGQSQASLKPTLAFILLAAPLVWFSVSYQPLFMNKLWLLLRLNS